MTESQHPDISRQAPWRMLGRALLLHCPNCGGGGLFTGFFKIRERCPTCGILLERGESDYFLGAYTINLIAVEVLLAMGFVVVMYFTLPNPPWDALEYGGAVTDDVGEDVKLGVVPVDEFSVVPDFLCLLNRHDCAPVKSSTRKVRIRQGSGGVNECAGKRT